MDNYLELAQVPQGVLEECGKYYTATYDNYGAPTVDCVTRFLNYREALNTFSKIIDEQTLKVTTLKQERGYFIRGKIDGDNLSVHGIWYCDAVNEVV